MLAFKVVNKDRESGWASRYECNVEKGYVLKYKKGTIVKAVENTVGIFCFKNEEDVTCHLKGRRKLIVIVVDGFERNQDCITHVPYANNFVKWYRGEDISLQYMWDGALLFKYVKVLT